MMLDFDGLPLHQFSKFNNFLWVCSFLGKNHSNFVPPLKNLTIRITIIPIQSPSTSLKVYKSKLVFLFWSRRHKIEPNILPKNSATLFVMMR